MEILTFNEIDPKKIKSAHVKDIQLHIKEREIQSAALLKEPQVVYEACLVCGSTENQQEIYKAQGFPWIYCPDCTHKYKKHMPDYERTLDQMREHSVELYLENQDFEYRISHVTKTRYDFVMRYHKGEPGRWLDLATGIGDIPYLFCEKGWDVDATEINESNAKAAAERLPFAPKQQTLFEYVDDFEQRNEELFDIVGAFGYFDMLPNPVEHTKTINKILKMGGLMAFGLPRNESLTGALAELWPDTSLRAITQINYSHFTEKSIFKMLDMGGFEPLGVLRHGLDIHELAMRMSEHAPEFSGSAAASIIYDLFNGLQRVVDEAGYSDTILICAQKTREL